MFATTIKPLALAFTIATGLGVLIHDTHLDKASKVALSAPIVIASYGLAHSVDLKGTEHTHTETMAENLKRMVAGQPRIHTRFADEKKYVTPKKSINNTRDDDQLFDVAVAT